MVSINTKIGNALGYTAKMMSRGLAYAQKEPAKAGANALVLSLVSKDVVSCIIYTTQTFCNKKYSDEKRRFVGYMDLVNGIINVVGQVLSYLCVEHFLTPKLEGLWSGKIKKHGLDETRTKSLFANDNITDIAAKVINENKADLQKYVNVDTLLKDVKDVGRGLFKTLGNEGSKAKDITTGVGIVVGSLATTALIKRVITPFFATPIAGALANRADDKAAAQKKLAFEAAAIASSRYENNMDKTPFSKISSRNSA